MKLTFCLILQLILEGFSKWTGTSFQNGARSKNAEKKLGRERRRVVLKSVLFNLIFLTNKVVQD